MSEEALANKILESIQTDSRVLYSEQNIRELLHISSQRNNEFKRSIKLLLDYNIFEKINIQNDVFVLKPKTQNENTPAKRSPKKRLRVSVTPCTKYKLNENTTEKDLPNDQNELHLLRFELLCKKRRALERYRDAEMKAKSTKKCEGKNLDSYIKKWKEISQEVLKKIQQHEMCVDEKGEKYTLSNLMKKLDVNEKLIGYNEEIDDFE